MSDPITRAEWESLTDDERWQSYALTEKALQQAESVLREIPECPDHGFCLPYFKDWIRNQQGKTVQPDGPLLELDRGLRNLLNQRLEP